jgi:hypothetical protein
MMQHKCGHSDRAAELIGRAVALRPQAAAFHANLAALRRRSWFFKLDSRVTGGIG